MKEPSPLPEAQTQKPIAIMVIYVPVDVIVLWLVHLGITPVELKQP